MPELLLDPGALSAEMRAHLDACPACREEFASLQKTILLLDLWQAPEPSPYFDQKLAVLLREEQALPPANWLERMRARLLFNTGRSFRPALVGAMALVLAIGGGTYIGVTNYASLSPSPQPNRVSATVNDLQILDRNAQAFQQMDQLLQDDTTDDAHPAVSPIS